MRSLSLMIALLIGQPLFAAKVDSVSKKTVTIFLQTLDDEDVQVGDLIYLTDSAGRRKATLKVTNNRGVMADTAVVSGSPSKSLKVQMPHEVKKKAAVVKKPPPRKAPPRKPPPKKVVKRKPRPAPVAPAPVVQPTPKPRPVSKRPPRRQRQKPADNEPIDTEDIEGDSEIALEPPEKEDAPLAKAPSRKKSESSSQSEFNWNISMDVLSLAGLLYDYQVFSFHAERRISRRFSLGASFNFGTFESNEGLDVTDKPLLRRSEYGGFLRFNFSGDIFESGIYTALAFKIAQENWVATPNFSEATDGGYVGVVTVGYQWMLRALTIRAGYAVQYSSLPEEAEFESVTHIRTEALLTGVAHYAVIQFGILF